MRREIGREKERGNRRMKLEKREIMLNEKDTLQEAIWLERSLLHAYIECMNETDRKQTRSIFETNVKEVVQDLYTLLDLAEERKGKVGIKS